VNPLVNDIAIMKAHYGFTVIELIVVLVIVAIGSVQILSKTLRDMAASRVDYEIESLASDLRHAQALARTWGRPLEFQLSGSSAYLVTCSTVSDGPCTSRTAAVTDPGRSPSPFSVSLASGLTIASNLPANTTLTFDSSGRPSRAVVFTISAGSRSRQLSVVAESGLVQLG